MNLNEQDHFYLVSSKSKRESRPQFIIDQFLIKKIFI